MTQSLWIISLTWSILCGRLCAMCSPCQCYPKYDRPTALYCVGGHIFEMPPLTHYIRSGLLHLHFKDTHVKCSLDLKSADFPMLTAVYESGNPRLNCTCIAEWERRLPAVNFTTQCPLVEELTTLVITRTRPGEITFGTSPISLTSERVNPSFSTVSDRQKPTMISTVGTQVSSIHVSRETPRETTHPADEISPSLTSKSYTVTTEIDASSSRPEKATTSRQLTSGTPRDGGGWEPTPGEGEGAALALWAGGGALALALTLGAVLLVVARRRPAGGGGWCRGEAVDGVGCPTRPLQTPPGFSSQESLAMEGGEGEVENIEMVNLAFAVNEEACSDV